MLTVLYAAKGGQGVTTIAAIWAASPDPPLFVDGGGDLLAALGFQDPPGDGLAGMVSGTGPIDVAALVEAAEADGSRVVPSGHVCGVPPYRWASLAAALAGDRRHWVVDAGSGPARVMGHGADRALIVTRNCYLALSRAARAALRPTGVVVVREPDRPLTDADIERVVRAPILATIEVSPMIARLTDAELLTGRLPEHVYRNVAGLAVPPDGR
jgi:hypothetical protein